MSREGVMIWKLDLIWLVMAVGAVSVLAFFVGHALDSILRSDGFGPFPTMFVFVAGFFGAIYLANHRGIGFTNLTHASGVGLGGAFIAIGALVLLKAGASRLLR